MTNVIVTGAFDNIRTHNVRFLEEAAKLGDLCVNLWSDKTIRSMSGERPKFPAAERLYSVQSVRFVHHAQIKDPQLSEQRTWTPGAQQADVWVVMKKDDCEQNRAFAAERGMAYHVIEEPSLMRIPPAPVIDHDRQNGRKKVVVTGCFDWLHSGHVRFFEETAAFGDLYVVLGHDENVRLLKGEGHPLFPAEERLYMVQAIRHVTDALVSTGNGWLDAAPEIESIKPDIYAVNEDGDQPEKRAFCESQGIEYLVLRRVPKEGLPARESTRLRGF